MAQVVLLHGKVRLHKGGSWNNRVTVPLYCPYSPDVTFTVSRLFGPLENAFLRRLLAVDDEQKQRT